MSPERSEKASINNLIGHFVGTLEFWKNEYKHYMVEIIIEFIMAGEVSRDKLWGSLGPTVLTILLDSKDYCNNVKIFDALLTWMKLDQQNIEGFL